MAQGSTERISIMPEYTFICDDCGEIFSIVSSISEYTDKQLCTLCQSENTNSDYQHDLASMTGSVVKADSELKTIGDLANRNRDKMTEDHKQALFKKHNAYRENPPEMPLPKNMKRIKKTKGIKWT